MGVSGQSGQEIKQFQVPRKISFTFHLSFILDDVKLAKLSRMKECDILAG